VEASLADIDALTSAIANVLHRRAPLADNAFKVELAQRVALRALQTAGARAMNASDEPMSPFRWRPR